MLGAIQEGNVPVITACIAADPSSLTIGAVIHASKQPNAALQTLLTAAQQCRRLEELVRARDISGSTALHHAWHKLNEVNIQLLRDAGSDDRAQTTAGRYLPYFNGIVGLHARSGCQQRTNGPWVHHCTDAARKQCYVAIRRLTDAGLLQEQADAEPNAKHWRVVKLNAFDCAQQRDGVPCSLFRYSDQLLQVIDSALVNMIDYRFNS